LRGYNWGRVTKKVKDGKIKPRERNQRKIHVTPGPMVKRNEGHSVLPSMGSRVAVLAEGLKGNRLKPKRANKGRERRASAKSSKSPQREGKKKKPSSLPAIGPHLSKTTRERDIGGWQTT